MATATRAGTGPIMIMGRDITGALGDRMSMCLGVNIMATGTIISASEASRAAMLAGFMGDSTGEREVVVEEGSMEAAGVMAEEGATAADMADDQELIIL